MKPLTVIVVDDEKPARDRLRFMLKDYPEFSIVAEGKNGKEAILEIEQHEPDVLFLDIQMPGLNGFDVIELLDKNRLPAIIFVTAFDQHAVKAFEVNALDYILKPFDKNRFDNTIQKIKTTSGYKKEARQKIRQLLSDQQTETYLKRLLIRDKNEVIIIKADEIKYIEAYGNYVRIHTANKKLLYRQTMKTMQARLDPENFIRTHRSTIVNIDEIKSIKQLSNNDYQLILRNKETLPLSRRFYPQVKTRLHLE